MIAALLLCCLLLLPASMMTACDEGGDSGFTTVSVMLFDRNNAPAGATLTDNRWTRYINEKMAKYKIKIEFVPVSRDNEVNDVNTLIMSKRGADIMMCYDGPLVQEFYYYGYTQDLGPYLKDENSKDLREYIGDDVLSLTTNSDGSMWAIRARRSTSEKYNLFIRKDWLDKLGMEVPTTVDELYDVLKAFKKMKSSTSYTRKDIIPGEFINSGAVGPLAASFLKSIGDKKEFAVASLETKGSMICSDEGYVEYLRYLNRLYNEGLISDSFIVTSDSEDIKRQYILEDRLGVYESPVNANVDALRGSILKELRETVPEADIISIPPMKNIWDGEIYNPGYSEGGAFLFIPTTCKHVEEAVTYLNWLATEEGGYTLYNGFEGEHFMYDGEGTPIAMDASYNAADKDWIRHDLFLVGNQGYFRTGEDFFKATAAEDPEYSDYVMNNYINASIGLVPEISYTSPTNAVQGTNLQSVCESMMVRVLSCKPEEFDEVIESFKSQLSIFGIDQIKRERQLYFNEMLP